MIDRVAIQGYKGSFHDLAVKKYYGRKKVKLVYCKTIIDVFETLEKGLADYAVTAIGNNHYGDVYHVNDILINSRSSNRSDYYIVGEVYLNISNCLLAPANTKTEDIRTIYSQAPTVIQCFNFIHARLSDALVIEQDDTALSAKLVSELDDKSSAAIASKEAAKIFKLKVLAEDIQDDVNNIYRFILISLNKPTSFKDSSKTTLLLSTRHKSGDLAKALELLANSNINLSFLQSIPIPNRPFEYRFYVDVDAGLSNRRLVDILEELQSRDYQCIIVGSYKKAALPRLKKIQSRTKRW